MQRSNQVFNSNRPTYKNQQIHRTASHTKSDSYTAKATRVRKRATHKIATASLDGGSPVASRPSHHVNCLHWTFKLIAMGAVLSTSASAASHKYVWRGAMMEAPITWPASSQIASLKTYRRCEGISVLRFEAHQDDTLCEINRLFDRVESAAKQCNALGVLADANCEEVLKSGHFIDVGMPYSTGKAAKITQCMQSKLPDLFAGDEQVLGDMVKTIEGYTRQPYNCFKKVELPEIATPSEPSSEPTMVQAYNDGKPDFPMVNYSISASQAWQSVNSNRVQAYLTIPSIPGSSLHAHLQTSPILPM